MPGTLEIDAESPQNAPAKATVVVTGAPPGASVTIALSPGAMPSPQTKVADGEGTAVAEFTIATIGEVDLLAAADDDQGTEYESVTRRITVQAGNDR